MDLSCGSGLFSRRFIKSGSFKGVIVSDFSENMLKQSSQFINEDPAIDPRSDQGRILDLSCTACFTHIYKMEHLLQQVHAGANGRWKAPI